MAWGTLGESTKRTSRGAIFNVRLGESTKYTRRIERALALGVGTSSTCNWQFIICSMTIWYFTIGAIVSWAMWLLNSPLGLISTCQHVIETRQCVITHCPHCPHGHTVVRHGCKRSPM